MSKTDIDALEPKKFIIIKGAGIHNLKNIDIAFPRNRLIVVTGVSGSGKSSLAFDTLYAEGQRRYVESLSSYARQFLGKMNKPKVDYIKGIAPTIAIEQKVNTRNPRSTVGTSTEIYEYLKLLYARIGITYSPVSGNQVVRHSVSDVVDFVINKADCNRAMITFPFLAKRGMAFLQQLNLLLNQGFTRIMVNDDMVKLEDIINDKNADFKTKDIHIIVDRIVFSGNLDELKSRIADSVQTCFHESNGNCHVQLINADNTIEWQKFSNVFELDGMEFVKPSVNFFSFNNPYGACTRCEGFGSIIGIDEDLVIPNKYLSVYDGAVACWKGEKLGEWQEQFILNAYKYDFPIHKPYVELTDKQKTLLWDGAKNLHGINDFFKNVEEQTYKIQYRVLLARYRGKTICPDCKGTRLRKDASYVKINGKSIQELVLMPVSQLKEFIFGLQLSEYQQAVAKRILVELKNRIQYLLDVGLGYLTLNRLSSSLSGGESQRINLSTALGSNLVGSIYVLDEPSIGLHSRDTQRLLHVIKQLRDLGNTVIVVEHDEEIMRAADQIVDIGVLAGVHGGTVVFQGTHEALAKNAESFTTKYLTHQLQIAIPEVRRKWKKYIEVIGAVENNLKNINVKFPLEVLTVVTGVSGSGKSSLVKNILYPALKKIKGGYGEKTGKFKELSGDLHLVNDVELVDQNPIGRSTRSNPVTYVKAFDEIRNLFAEQPLAKSRNYKPGFFSFNVPGGRCEECEGEGEIAIEMQFMADVKLVCEHCKGKRYQPETLEVMYKGKNINDVLNLTVDEAIDFFADSKTSNLEKKIIAKLKPLQDVGLGYITLGQSSSTLSGGEAQRVKLAYALSLPATSRMVYVFDEPTTGLHFHDINKLLSALNALINQGHTIIIIEHNLDVIKAADWVIDLGKDGGDAGGHVLFEGTPEKLIHCGESYTAQFLKEKMELELLNKTKSRN